MQYWLLSICQPWEFPAIIVDSINEISLSLTGTVAGTWEEFNEGELLVSTIVEIMAIIISSFLFRLTWGPTPVLLLWHGGQVNFFSLHLPRLICQDSALFQGDVERNPVLPGSLRIPSFLPGCPEISSNCTFRKSIPENTFEISVI